MVRDPAPDSNAGMRLEWSPRVWLPHLFLFVLLIEDVRAYISCYSCANDFVVWNWRHYFLKRNYHISQGENSCAHRTAFPESATKCSTSCFLLFINGTDKTTGLTLTLGVARGCSGSFLTDEQYVSRHLGVQSRPSASADYLPRSYDKYDISEHWCFCASDYCNVNSCFDEWRYSNAYGYAPLNTQRRYQPASGHDRRRESDYYSEYWHHFYNAAPSSRTSIFSLVSSFLFFLFVAR
ncbi:hypothetical protein M3Y99_01332300 [Aphelenchoides fujianensis]|nr:hypothetical protein M3Y99_01332300 [Aphelenchoides fujianensis]